ncbi:MAG: NTP transferase domain-containing protein [Candidatus Cybelea sp.]
MTDLDARAVILAAGTSSRIGKQKLLMDFRGRALIEHAIAAAQRWHPVVVCGREVAEYLARRSDLALVLNDEPERGMSHSLALANRYLRSDVWMLVVLGDKPLVNEALIETICAETHDADLAYPQREDEPGHPVLLSPRARRFIEYLPSGDTLRRLRSNPHLTSRAMQTDDPGAFFDVDTLDAIES